MTNYIYNSVNVTSGSYSLDLSGVAPTTVTPSGSFPASGLPAGVVSLQVEGATSGAIGTGNFTIFISYQTTADGEWTVNSKWDTNVNPNSPSVKTHIANNITIPESNTIEVDEITIDENASLHNNGSTFTINGNIILKNGADNKSAKFLNNGNLINRGKIIIRKSFSRTFGWYFMSFPFDVPADRIFIAGTNTIARWGDPTTAATSTNDFYVSEYDGAKRDNTGVVNYTIDSPNWKDVTPHTLIAKKGYIIAVPGDIEIDFVSGSQESALFSTTSSNVSVNKYLNNSYQQHNSWNLIGTPYASAYDLKYATEAPFYHYNNVNYDVVMSGDNVVLNPYTSFFLQATTNTVDFNISGKALIRSQVAVNTFDEINLQLNGPSYSDKTRLRFDDNASTDYIIGQDAVKMFSPVTGVPQIYSKIGSYPVAVNTLPRNINTVDLTIKTPVTGSYSITLNNSELAKSYSVIKLIDNLTGKQQDLLTDNTYNFTSSSTTASTRFKVVLTGNSNTGIDNISDNRITVYSIQNKTFIEGIENQADINVYDTTGKLISTFNNITNKQAIEINYNGMVVLRICEGNRIYNVKTNL